MSDLIQKHNLKITGCLVVLIVLRERFVLDHERLQTTVAPQLFVCSGWQRRNITVALISLSRNAEDAGKERLDCRCLFPSVWWYVVLERIAKEYGWCWSWGICGNAFVRAAFNSCLSKCSFVRSLPLSAHAASHRACIYLFGNLLDNRRPVCESCTCSDQSEPCLCQLRGNVMLQMVWKKTVTC